MSAPDTNTSKQSRRHKPALIAIGLAILFGAAMMIGLGVFVADEGGEPTAAGVTNTNEENVDDSSATPPVDEVEPGTNESN